MLELPSPSGWSILGRLSLPLPDEDAAVVALHLDVLGILDFDRGEVSVDATLYDSRLAVFVAHRRHGDAARLGDDPIFALSVGGFNPRFQPPPGFPTLERLALSLATGDNPRLRLEAYLALTPNTLQFGARHRPLRRASASMMLGYFSVDAHLGFDVLVIFFPFSLEADITGTVDLQAQPEVLPRGLARNPPEGPGAVARLGRRRSSASAATRSRWTRRSARPPRRSRCPSRGRSTRCWTRSASRGTGARRCRARGDADHAAPGSSPADGEIRSSPRGAQRAPTDRPPRGDDREVRRDPADRAAALRYHAGGPGRRGRGRSTDSGREHFAPAQFFKLSDDEKLSRPGFEAFEAGKRIGTSGVDHPVGVETTFGYEDVVVDLEPNTGVKLRRAGNPQTYTPTSALLTALAAGGTSDTYAAEGQEIAFAEPVYVVAGTDDLEVSAAVGATPRRS